jgi:septal ring factor EnvC (AmiA/AmiB activator)
MAWYCEIMENIIVGAVQLISLASFYFLLRRDRKSEDKELKTETKDTVKTETGQTLQIVYIQKQVDDHETRLRKNEHDIIRTDSKICAMDEKLDDIKATQEKILERLPAPLAKVSSYGGA